MSYLNLPRLCFQGKYRANVATANNFPALTLQVTEGGADSVVVVPVSNVVTVRCPDPFVWEGQALTDAQTREFLAANGAPDALKKQILRRNWNYYGLNDTSIFDTVVTSVDEPGGSGVGDPLLGKPVSQDKACMTDMNSAGIFLTQVFCDSFAIGDDTGGVSGRPERAYSRWVWFTRNPSGAGDGAASGVFQMVIPKETLAFRGADTGVLKAFADAMADDAISGLSVRYCFYATGHPGSDGSTTPAVGVATGAIGLQYVNETTTVPFARYLMPTNADQAVTGVAFAAEDRGRQVLTLDLVTTVPEVDQHLNKADLGTLTVSLVEPGGTTVTVGTVAPSGYGKAAYDKTSGLVDVPYAAIAAADGGLPDGLLAMTWSNDANSAMAELDRVVTADRHASYLQQNGAGETLTIRSLSRGRAAPGVEFYADLFPFGNDGDPGNCPDPHESPVVLKEDALVTDGAGVASLVIERATEAGYVALRFRPAGVPVTPFNNMRDEFALVRVLPEDDYSQVSDDELKGEAGWQLVYKNVLRFYYLLFPGMSVYVDFSSRTNVLAMESKLVASIDPAIWHSVRYMPRTRDLSDGKRRLLLRWFDVNRAPTA